MGRRPDPNAQYRVKPHITKGYTYASTQPPYTDLATGKKKYRYIHWGTVDENLVFIPGTAFYLASPEERERLVFPESWDMREAEKLTGLRKPGKPESLGQINPGNQSVESELLAMPTIIKVTSLPKPIPWAG